MRILTRHAIMISGEMKNMKNLRIRRKEKGFTCESLGNLINVQKSAVSKYERDEIQPSKDILLKMSEVLDCTTDYLYGLTDDPKPLNKPVENDYDSKLNARDRRDIAKQFKKMIEDFDGDEALIFDGEPVDDETRELLKISIENTLKLAKVMAKEKFTPHKYKMRRQ